MPATIPRPGSKQQENHAAESNANVGVGLRVLFSICGQTGGRARCAPGRLHVSLATIMPDLNRQRVVLPDRQPIVRSQADKLTATPICRDCRLGPARQGGPDPERCDLCYVNRLIHGRTALHV